MSEMSVVEQQLQRLQAAGLEFETFERFPRAVGVRRGDAIALLEATPEGLRIVGSPGWRMGEVMGVLVEKNGRWVFQYKDQVVEATAARRAEVQRLREEIEGLLAPRG